MKIEHSLFPLTPALSLPAYAALRRGLVWMVASKRSEDGGEREKRSPSSGVAATGFCSKTLQFSENNQRLFPLPTGEGQGEGKAATRFQSNSSFAKIFIGITFSLNAFLAGIAGGAETNSAASLTDGWKPVPFTFQIQHPYDLKTSDRYDFDATNNVHHFWVYFSDKPHAPPPNQTTARTEMRLETFSTGERMFDGDVYVCPGTFACIAQVFDAKHGPMQMIIAHPDGRVTMRDHDLIMTNAVGKWWNLKMSNDTKAGGKVKIYANDVLVGTYDSRGPRDYYFKCGVYSRKDSDRSEVRYRNIKLWAKQDQ